jgi:hypothetical protein
MEQLPIQVAENNLQRTVQAARLKVRNRMFYADAFIAALGQELRAMVVTGDKEFECLQSELDILWL